MLVHCSDGWDRTAQLTSLSMLMLDPAYRTLSGFVSLVEKEWFGFGHKFCDRFGFSHRGWNDDDRSPVFQQFIDCVYQIMLQMPGAFEFNETFLLFVLHGLQSGLFGNIFANCEKERVPLESCTLSIWSVVLGDHSDVFMNSQYQKMEGLCVPVTSAKHIVLWNSWFLGWHDSVWRRIWNSKMEDLHTADESFVDSIIPCRWVENSAVKNCSDASCNRPFTIFRRRHHCRACGLIFCEKCSAHRRVVPAVSSSTLSRCCKSCAHQFDVASRLMSRKAPRPKAVGIISSKRPIQSKALVADLADSDDIEISEQDLVADGPGKTVSVVPSRRSYVPRPTVGSLRRRYEISGADPVQLMYLEKKRSKSFSDVPI